MAVIELILPAMGEGIIEATLTSWIANEGDVISIDDPVIEVATDKVNSEVPSTHTGILQKKLFNIDDVIPVGSPFAIIATEGEEVSSEPVTSAPKKEETKKSEPKIEKVETSTTTPQTKKVVTPQSTSDRFYSPLVMNIAKEEGISQQELDAIPGSGKDGRVTKYDIKDYIQNRGQALSVTPNTTTEITPQTEKQETNTNIAAPVTQNEVKKFESVDFGPNVEVKKMDRMRSLIAKHMVNSVQTSPHVCSFVEADMTNIVIWRNKVKTEFQSRYGEKLTFTPIILEAIAKTIREFPDINASLEGDNILIHKEVNIGMAAALPDGNLIVPVIKNADTLNLLGLAKKVNDLGARAKANTLKPDEIQGGTYTMTNLGSFGNLFGTPIINQPQVAIMGVGAIVKKPVVVENQDGDTIAIRSMMYLSHSYDHRIVDGFLGGSFVKRLAENLENFDIHRSI